MAYNSRAWLDTVTSWLLAPCSEDHDPRSGYRSSGGCGMCAVEEDFSEDDVLNRAESEKRALQVYYDQPRPTSPIRAASSRPMSRLHKDRRARTRMNEKNRSWMDERLHSGKTTRMRRPQISSPFNFQHTSTGAVDFNPSGPRSAPLFRPLELSIFESNNPVSPLLPYFIGPNPAMSPPPRAYTRPRSRTEALPDVFDDDDDDAAALAHSRNHSRNHSRSQSDLSFHIPRRPVNDAPSFVTASISETPPRIPPRAAGRNRQRAYTSPSVEKIVERIASALIERELLEAELESIKERHSICLSRPSTSYDPDEPLPAFPIMPPTAPSFAERVSIDRPRTAPSTQAALQPPPPPPPPPAPTPAPGPGPAISAVAAAPARAPLKERAHSFQQPAKPRAAPEAPSKKAVPTSAFNSHPPYSSPKIIDNSVDMGVPLAPPLPLILRPPLRKKKSFSRVSDWLFPAGGEADESERRAVAAAAAAAAAAAPANYGYGHGIKHRRDVSRDSVTNTPRALAHGEGYYQTLPLAGQRQGSFGTPMAAAANPYYYGHNDDDDASLLRRRTSYSAGSVYSTDEEGRTTSNGDEGGAGTMTVATSTQWSPGSTPPAEVMRKAHAANWSLSGVSVGRRVGTFGSDQSSPVDEADDKAAEAGVRLVRRQPAAPATIAVQGPRPTSVGVAF